MKRSDYAVELKSNPRSIAFHKLRTERNEQ